MHTDELVNGANYQISVTPVDQPVGSNPFQLQLVAFEKTDIDSPREFIKKWFSRKGENPGDAATIASQLRLNELELYTQTERFIFELLQNADDMPTKNKKVNVSMELLGDYFLFLHDGKFFDRNDVMAIADAARSTKLRDKAKTGYKGIGFKSVFTDSTRVFIKSHDYSFKFDKLHSIYSDFWQLYGKYVADSSEAKQNEIRREYTGREDEFTQIERIPWQIKPIWVERAEFPTTLNTSTFLSSHNVSIGLEIGQSTLVEKQYNQKISNLLGEPRFLLFLRNITSVAYKHDSHSITLAMERATESQFNIRLNDAIHSTYTKWEADIIISNESFAAAGLHFQKRTLQDGKYEFVTDDGQLIKNIPEKLSILDKTALTFAAQIQGNKIRSIPKEEAILFNYLPTSDKRFEFPFLVNADFVTKTDRESILHENLWNQYLFYHIGYLHVKWLHELASTISFQSSYLTLLVNGLKDEMDQSEGEINAAFNRGLSQAIAEVPFIQTEAGGISVSADIILDETKLASVLGPELFYALTGTAKTLPDTRIKASILRRDFLSIEQFNVEHLADLLAKKESIALFAEVVSTFDDLRYKAFMTWFDIHCKENEALFNSLVPTLPFFRFGNEGLSWSAMANEEEYLLLDDRTYGLQSELAALGFIISALNIDHFPALKSALVATNTYVDKGELLYAKVSKRCSQHRLKPAQKATLFTFLAGLTNENEYASTLYLFADASGICRPLDELVSRNVDGLPAWLASYKITESEFRCLPSSAGKHLVRGTNLFSQIFCNPAILAECNKSLDSHHVSEWVFQLQTWRNEEEPKTTDSGWSALPWVYTNDTHRFKAAAELWDHDALTTVSAQAVIETLTGWVIPHPDARPLIQQFGLLLKSANLTNGITQTDVSLSEADTKLLIQYLKEAGEATFLRKWTFSVSETGLQLNAITNKTVFAADESIRSFVETSGLRESFITVPDGLADTDTLVAIGAITSDALLALLAEQQAVLSLAPLLLKRADTQLYATYLQNLPALAISSTVTYTPESPEVQVLKITHDLPDRDNSAYFRALLDKATLDGQPLSESKAYLATVTVKNIAGKEPFKFSTAELLPNYTSRIEQIQKAIAAFSGCSKLISPSFIRDKIFSSEELKARDAESEIFRSKPEYLSPTQLVFLQAHKLSRNEPHSSFQTKHFFTYWSEQGQPEKAWSELGTYLNLLYDREIVESHIPLELDQCVLDPDYCLAPEEALPNFFAKWADTEEKWQFLTELNEGANGPESDVVKLRKALLESDNATADVRRRSLSNGLLINTIQWLCEKQNDTAVTACIGSIGNTLDKVQWPAGQKPIVPIITSITDGIKTYRLAEFADQIVHTWSEEWEPYETDILRLLTAQKAWVVENSFPVALDTLIGKLDTVAPIKKLALDILEGSTRPSAPFYEKCELKDEYPIHVIRGTRIPWQVWYGDHLVLDEEGGESYFDEETNTTYLTPSKAEVFPLGLPANFPSDLEHTLFRLALSFHDNPEGKVSAELSFAESHDYNAVDESIQSGRELGDEQQLRVYGEAVQRGKKSLEEDGYDFTDAIQAEIGYFKDVKSRDSDEQIEVYFRSAKGGLLYLNPGLWLRLDEPNLLLVVLYADGKPRYIKSKKALLRGKYNDYLLLRTVNTVQPEETDKIAKQLNDATGHLLFITSSEMQKTISQEFEGRLRNPSLTPPLSDKYDL